MSIYSPLQIVSATMNGTATSVAPGRERGRSVYSVFADMPAQSTGTLDAELSGNVRLHGGWYELVVRHQATLNPDRLHVSVDVPKGWRIDEAPGMERPFGGRASATLELERTKTFGVHIVRDPGTWDLWTRLEAGA